MSFFLVSFSSFSLLIFLQAKIIGARRSSETTYLSGLLRPTWEGVQGEAPSAIWESTCGLHGQNPWCHRLYWFSTWTSYNEPLKSLLCYSNYRRHHPDGIPGSNRGWTPVLQLQHQSFQWIFRVDFLWDWLVWSPCSPRDSQESSPILQFKSINSSELSFLYGPLLTSTHNYWKNHILVKEKNKFSIIKCPD